MHVFDGFQKRDGSVVPFDASKIQTAMWKASWEIFRRETGIPAECLPKVLDKLNQHLNGQNRRIPTLEQVQDNIMLVLYEEGHREIARAFGDFRDARDKARKGIQVKKKRGKKSAKNDTTDQHLLLVESGQDPGTAPWDRSRISGRLSHEEGIPEIEACVIAKIVENRIIASGTRVVTAALIRELTNTVLSERGHTEALKASDGYFVPVEYIENLMDTKSQENSNIGCNNPEAVSMLLSELVLKEWALDKVYSPEVRRAHLTGKVHIHDLGFPHRVYCSAHSLEFLKKYGLVGLGNLSTESYPANSASVLTGHLNTFLASIQANYAGALGIGYLNVFYAPYMVGLSDKQVKQIAQEIIFSISQCCFARGGQAIFSDFNIHAGTPPALKDIPAVHPGGHYLAETPEGLQLPLKEILEEGRKDSKGNALLSLGLPAGDSMKILAREQEKAWEYLPDDTHRVLTYKDYDKEATRFCLALMQVWGEGDKHGRIFPFPKCNFHIDDDLFSDKDKLPVFVAACDLSSKNGSTYFIFDRDAVTLAACCRLRTTIEDKRMLTRPELMSFCGFQNVTVNIPQAAYRATSLSGDPVQNLLKEIDDVMDLCMEAHLQKRETIRKLMNSPTGPLYQIGKTWAHGRAYVDIDKATYIIGIIGVNDAVFHLTGKHLHESEEATDLGLTIVAHMYVRAGKLAEKHGLKVTLEESPAESAARRLARTDLALFPDKAEKTVQGGDAGTYYTNSIHLQADADVGLVERIRAQSMYHPMIESGAIIHAFVGEERPGSGAIGHLVRNTFENTQCAQLTVSPEFTYCNVCQENSRGVLAECPRCGTSDVDNVSRVVGYFSKIQNWNKSKKDGELPDRQKGKYAITE